MRAFCFLYFVFKQFDAFEKVFSKCFNKFIVIYHFKYTRRREGKVVNAQNDVFYFECDIPKVFPFRPTCSSYDSEIEKKSKRAKKDQERKWTNVKLGLTAYMYGISSF